MLRCENVVYVIDRYSRFPVSHNDCLLSVLGAGINSLA